MKLKYIDKFKYLVESPQIILDGFYIQFGSGIGLIPELTSEELIHYYYEDSRKSIIYEGNSLVKGDGGGESLYTSIEIAPAEREGSYGSIYFLYIYQLDNWPGDLYPRFDPSNPNPIYWNPDGTPTDEFYSTTPGDSRYIRYRVELAGVMDEYHNLNVYGSNIINMQILPRCDIKLHQRSHIEHITSDRVDKKNYHSAEAENQFLNLDSAIDKIQFQSNQIEKHTDSFSINPSGKIVV
jgi:hypothetical protein